MMYRLVNLCLECNRNATARLGLATKAQVTESVGPSGQSSLGCWADQQRARIRVRSGAHVRRFAHQRGHVARKRAVGVCHRVTVQSEIIKVTYSVFTVTLTALSGGTQRYRRSQMSENRRKVSCARIGGAHR